MNFSASEGEQDYFAYTAMLRIHGQSLPFDQISSKLGVLPTHTHKAGKRRRPAARPYPDDAWHLTAPLAEEAELTEHLRWLWTRVEPAVEFLTGLDAKVDVFCGYRSNNGASGFAVEPDALQIFNALKTPFGVSVIVDSWLGERLSEPTEH